MRVLPIGIGTVGANLANTMRRYAGQTMVDRVDGPIAVASDQASLDGLEWIADENKLHFRLDDPGDTTAEHAFESHLDRLHDRVEQVAASSIDALLVLTQFDGGVDDELAPVIAHELTESELQPVYGVAVIPTEFSTETPTQPDGPNFYRFVNGVDQCFAFDADRFLSPIETEGYDEIVQRLDRILRFGREDSPERESFHLEHTAQALSGPGIAAIGYAAYRSDTPHEDGLISRLRGGSSEQNRAAVTTWIIDLIRTAVIDGSSVSFAIDAPTHMITIISGPERTRDAVNTERIRDWLFDVTRGSVEVWVDPAPDVDHPNCLLLFTGIRALPNLDRRVQLHGNPPPLPPSYRSRAEGGSPDADQSLGSGRLSLPAVEDLFDRAAEKLDRFQHRMRAIESSATDIDDVRTQLDAIDTQADRLDALPDDIGSDSAIDTHEVSQKLESIIDRQHAIESEIAELEDAQTTLETELPNALDRR